MAAPAERWHWGVSEMGKGLANVATSPQDFTIQSHPSWHEVGRRLCLGRGTRRRCSSGVSVRSQGQCTLALDDDRNSVFVPEDLGTVEVGPLTKPIRESEFGPSPPWTFQYSNGRGGSSSASLTVGSSKLYPGMLGSGMLVIINLEVEQRRHVFFELLANFAPVTYK